MNLYMIILKIVVKDLVGQQVLMKVNIDIMTLFYLKKYGIKKQ